jgi:hypothetical protein
MTRQNIAIGFVAVALFVGSMTAHADDFDVGVKAHERGDYATALRIFRQLADQGYALAQNNLGVMYDKGRGVKQDYAEAVRWYRKAADQGIARAQSNLGTMYHLGTGVKQDVVQAHMWYYLAAAQGNKLARKFHDSLAEKMTPAQIAEAQRLARYWKLKGK